jgi:hypothetical protein
VVLVSSISNVFTSKTSLANKWMSFSSSNLALVKPVEQAKQQMLRTYCPKYMRTYSLDALTQLQFSLVVVTICHTKAHLKFAARK